jgi:hypothetical protein
MAFRQRLKGGRYRLDHQDHAGSSPKRGIVDLAVGPLAKRTEINQLDLEQSFLDGTLDQRRR